MADVHSRGTVNTPKNINQHNFVSLKSILRSNMYDTNFLYLLAASSVLRGFVRLLFLLLTSIMLS